MMLNNIYKVKFKNRPQNFMIIKIIADLNHKYHNNHKDQRAINTMYYV
jgi:hypothetical protein